MLNCWEEEIDRISGNKSDEMGEIDPKIQPSIGNYSRKRAIYVSSASGAEDLLREANILQLSHVGLNMVFSFDSQILAGDLIVPDITTIRPYLLAVTLAEYSKSSAKAGRLHNYVINLRVKSLHKIIQRLFQLPVCFVGYDLKHTLFCLWQLNINRPEMIWDVLIHEKTMHLGVYHRPAKSNIYSDDIFNQIREKEDRKQLEQFQMGWPCICQRYGVSYRNNGNSKLIEDSIFNHPRLRPYTAKQINYVTADAIAAARIYPHQISTAAQSGILHHLITIEMPFITTVAKMEWNGVGFDQERYDIIADTYRTSIKKLEKKIAKHGIGNPRSHKVLQRFFKSAGIINKFAHGVKYSFEKEQLERNLDTHPVVRKLLNYRQLFNLLGSASKLEDFVAFDDRLHAQYHSVGAVSGRLTTHNPNIVGLDSRLRHLIKPEPGNGIGEADWCQFEVGITAAVYGDEKLLKMFNDGDVYTLMAKEFFKDKISNSERKLSDKTFKQRFPDLRDKMKICVLGVIYGMTPSTLSELLKCSRKEAQQLHRKFLQMFPSLSKAREETYINNERRGYATTATGLKRHRSKINPRQVGKENWLINHPIQGTAAAIFKMTASRLDKLYRLHDARIIIPMHDAFVFEAPIDELDQVAHLTEQVMCETVREFYPMLQPRVEIDMQSPEHWGQRAEIQSFIKP